MPRKKSIKLASQWFQLKAGELVTFCSDACTHVGAEQQSWIYEYAIIRLYREFERLMLEGIVGTINNDTATFSITVGIPFPKHLTDEVCEYLVLGNGYFDFRGRDGLIKELKRYVPDTHYFLVCVKKPKYKDSLEQLSALRNFAAHDSFQSKRNALRAVGLDRMGSAGSWLKRQGRFEVISSNLKELAQELRDAAPY
ncbi:MAG: hypothetical protein ABL983_14160 [Nitrospira sp.]